MEQKTAERVYTELHSIRETLVQIERELERLSLILAGENGSLSESDYMAIVGLGASGSTDVSVEHDRYVGQAIADEHLS